MAISITLQELKQQHLQKEQDTMSTNVCPRCGYSADSSQFSKAAKAREADTQIFDAAERIRKSDGLSARERDVLLSELHKREMDLKNLRRNALAAGG